MINNFIAITIGDIKGIGIEILLKLWKKNKINRFIIFSNKQIIQNYLNKKKLKIQLKIINNQIKIINKSAELKAKIKTLKSFSIKNKCLCSYVHIYNNIKLL